MGKKSGLLHIFLAMILHLLPSGSYEKYVRLLAGMVFLLVPPPPLP